MQRINSLFISFIILLFLATTAHATDYYVSNDENEGSDSNLGTSSASPWRSLDKVSGFDFNSGDKVMFKRGETWTGQLSASRNGVTYSAYGSGNLPIIRNPGGGTWGSSILLTGDNNTIEYIHVKEANQTGIDLQASANGNVIQYCEASDTGSLVLFQGSNNRASYNTIHDMRMVVNTPGGDDDFGANGFNINGASDIEISYNTAYNLIAPSYDYGTDGGFIEGFSTHNRMHIHHNLVYDSDAFIETGGGTNHDSIIHHNIIMNNRGRFAVLHTAGNFYVDLDNLRVENNTFYEVGQAAGNFIWTDGGISSGQVTFKNNIVWNSSSDMGDAPDNRSNNLYYGNSGWGSEPGGITGENPQFEKPGVDFYLQSSSRAIEAGANLGYTADFDGNAIPQGSEPDIGAYEYTGNATPSAPQNLEIMEHGG